MQFQPLEIDGLILVNPRIFADERGSFFESYQQGLYRDHGISEVFVQDNVSVSKQGTIRALHYQSSPGQAKLVSCLQGAIWDVAVDIRPASPTFGKWIAVELNDQTHRQLFIPVGFAHGFCVLTPFAKVHYKVSAPYNAKTDCSIRWNDPDLNINWPSENPILSPRDQISPFFREVVWTR